MRKPTGSCELHIPPLTGKPSRGRANGTARAAGSWSRRRGRVGWATAG